MVPQVVGNVRFSSTEPPRTPTRRTKVFQLQIPIKQAYLAVSSHLAYVNTIQDPLDNCQKKRTLLPHLKLLAILPQLTHFRMPKILTMATTWTVIMNLERSRTAFRFHSMLNSSPLHSSATIQNSLRTCRADRQSYYAELLFQKSKGTEHCS